MLRGRGKAGRKIVARRMLRGERICSSLRRHRNPHVKIHVLNKRAAQDRLAIGGDCRWHMQSPRIETAGWPHTRSGPLKLKPSRAPKWSRAVRALREAPVPNSLQLSLSEISRWLQRTPRSPYLGLPPREQSGRLTGTGKQHLGASRKVMPSTRIAISNAGAATLHRRSYASDRMLVKPA